MKPSDFLTSEQSRDPNFPSIVVQRYGLKTELVDRLCNGPLEGVTDLEAAQALTRLVHTELENNGTGGGEKLKNEEMAEALRTLKFLLLRLKIDLKAPFDDFQSFRKYWIREGMGGGGGYAKRRSYLDGLFYPVREKLDEMEVTASSPTAYRGVDGEIKNIIFAPTGPTKPDIFLEDALSNIIKVANEDKCLVYNRPLTDAGLTWGDLMAWWTEKNGLEDASDYEVAQSLWLQLLESVPSSSPPARALFMTYCRRHISGGVVERNQPALLPEVYLHFDPLTKIQRGKLGKPRRLVRERMDFLLLLPGGVRIVIEVDGKHHYAREVPEASRNWKAAPDRYAEMVAEDRALRLKGYEVFRFGGKEIKENDSSGLVGKFFDGLEARFGAKVAAT